MRFTILLSVLTLLYSCKPRKNIVVDNSEFSNEQTMPDWVKNHPVSADYYIGVGFGNKNNQNIEYRAQAKKNALNDLASEISVTIKSNSFLFTMEYNDSFNEEFKSTIKTEISKDLEGYELVDSWENKSIYKVYYRLSKSEYHQKQKKEKEKTLRLCYDLYQKAIAAEEKSDILLAISLNARALLSIKKYWNEINEYNTGNKVIFLENEISANIERILSQIKLEPANKQFELSYTNRYSNSLKINCLFKNEKISSLPLILNYYKKAKYTESKKKYTEAKTSEANGAISFLVSDLFMLKEQELTIEVNIMKMLNVDKENLNLMTGVSRNFPAIKMSVPVKIFLPKIFIDGNEKSLGNETINKLLSNTFKENFIKNNYDVVDKKPSDGLTLLILTDTKSEQNKTRFVPAYLNGEILLKNNSSSKTVYSKALSNIKGVHSTADKASLKAYQETTQLINKSLFKDMLKTISN
jgi:hypothetical protein